MWKVFVGLTPEVFTETSIEPPSTHASPIQAQGHRRLTAVIQVDLCRFIKHGAMMEKMWKILKYVKCQLLTSIHSITTCQEVKMLTYQKKNRKRCCIDLLWACQENVNGCSNEAASAMNARSYISVQKQKSGDDHIWYAYLRIFGVSTWRIGLISQEQARMTRLKSFWFWSLLFRPTSAFSSISSATLPGTSQLQRYSVQHFRSPKKTNIESCNVICPSLSISMQNHFQKRKKTQMNKWQHTNIRVYKKYIMFR